MNKWIKLDKNNLPSDILVEGKYEFRGFSPRAAEPFLLSRGVNAIADIDIGSPVEYMEKSTPMTFKARVIDVENKIDKAYSLYGSRLLPSTVITIKAQGYVDLDLTKSEDMIVTFSPID